MSISKGLVVILMSGGLGKRMESDLPKVLHKVGGVPMLVRVLQTIQELDQKIPIEKIIVVVGKHRPLIISTLESYLDIRSIQFIEQKEALGTGNAIQCCQTALFPYTENNVLILSGDVPLISSETLYDMTKNVRFARILTATVENPSGYGRIILSQGVAKDGEGEFEKIVEEKDCNEMEKKIHLINGGIYTIDCRYLCRYLPHLKPNNQQGEYYLTDIVCLIRNREKIEIEMIEIPADKTHQILGVNTRSQLLELEKILDTL